MSKLASGQRVSSSWATPNGIVVFRKDTGYLSPEYADIPAVRDVVFLATDDDEFIVLRDDGIAGYGYDGDGDYEAIEE
jgi:hypothetical protein